ncbi:zinc-binding dehydrogenase [Bacillus sp. FJAT-44742]|uniref:zinc-binding dehydrogenase n=1 Tax=Bacillus sp. FJAT-44742 TaxID=2014005 RepID=UPI000C23C308|nr:zinc-binding dehydrogenase [Bacillus sp. FJAT-44742]
MKALAVKEGGNIDNLQIMDVDKPVPGSGQVRIKVHFSGLNPVDYKLIENPLPEWEFPHISGLDIAGEIDDVGSEVSGWFPGDKVFYHGSMVHQGGFAEYTIADPGVLAPLPDGWSWQEAAALPTAALTAYQSLFRKVPIQKGQSILIQAGAGGVGGFAIQFAKMAGLNIITTCSPRNVDHVRKLGADKVIDYNRENVIKEVHKYTNGRGADIIMDMVGEKTATEALDMLTFNGHLVSIVDFPDLTQYQPKSIAPSIHEVALGFVYRTDDEYQKADLGKMAREIGKLAEENKIDPLLEEEILLEDVPETLYKIKKGHVRGKIVARIS